MLIEIALVSEQPLANLLPALHERPDRVLLAASAEMARRGLDVRQRRLLAQFGIDAQIVPGAPDADLARIHEFALDLLGKLQAEHPGAALVLNATGGNKLMMLGFVEVFRADARVVYADTQHGRIETLAAGGGAREAAPMRDLLDVPGYLRAQGFACSGARSDRAAELQAAAGRKPAAKHLGAHAEPLGGFLGALNRLVAKALDARGEQLVAPSHAFDSVRSADWREALAVLNRCGALKWFGAEDIEFTDAEAARFCGGGWLEEYVWHVVRDARPFDARWSVRGAWEGGAENEFDVLAAHGNRMLFIECKTLRLGADESRDAELLYKLDSLGRLARGLFGATWLVTARGPTPAMAERAREQRIRLVGPAELPRVRDRVLDWMSGRG
jgi:hypothetical protein